MTFVERTGVKARLSASSDKASDFVSVVIPHYNDLAALKVCLAGLARQTWPAGRMEIIVADNNSACGLPAVLETVLQTKWQVVEGQAVGCRLIAAHIQGAGPARNAGAAVARGTILAFIDSDCDPEPEWIEHGVRALADYDFIGGRVLTVPRDPVRPTPVEAWEMEFGFDFERYVLVDGYTGSGNMWVWRPVFDAVGGFRTGVAEDMDWSFRARAAGYRLGYEKRAVVRHLARPDWADLLTRWRRVLAEHYATALERPFGRLYWACKTAVMPLSVVPHLWRVVRSEALPDVRSRVAAAGVLAAHRAWRTGYMLRLLLCGTRPRSTERGRAGAGSHAGFLGLPFSHAPMREAVLAVTRRASGDTWQYVVTPNAAHLARLRRDDSKLRQIYKESSLCFLDSRVISLAAKLCGLRPPPVVPGSDLVEALFQQIITPETPVCIVGGEAKAIAKLRRLYGLKCVSHFNPTPGFWNDTDEVNRIVDFVNSTSAAYTFLVVGSPQQEVLAHRIAVAGGARGVGICAGASIDFIAGEQTRAPRWMQRLALEWAFRLLREPRRLARRYLVESPQGVALVIQAATDALRRPAFRPETTS